MRFLLFILPLCAMGCAHTLGYAGKNPGAMECYGKASITVTGSGSIAAGYGGTELNSGSIQFDCGDGAGLKQFDPRNPPP
jgi:hypothetical protein